MKKQFGLFGRHARCSTVDSDASSSNHDERLGSLEFSAVAATINLVENRAGPTESGTAERQRPRVRSKGQRNCRSACWEIGRIWRVHVCGGMQIITFDVEASDSFDNEKIAVEEVDVLDSH